MAHTCPRCGQLCHCGGDIDDMDMGELSSCYKDHYGCLRDDEDDDDDFVDDDPAYLGDRY